MKDVKLISIFLILFALYSCSTCVDVEKEKENLKQTDIAFSDYSIKYGMNAAFAEYLHEEGVMLRDSSMPVVGFKNVKALFSGDDSKVQLSWEPLFTKISKSGELGYTYGTYDFLIKSTGIHRYGTYVAIWEKNDNDEWKMILDSGNNGLKKKI